ncbi:class I SAM-dependent methyltransferase [Sutcliffiella horikoshii]|nr:class I SAM-dependent methyltransferase [Sutcliffiella horikoshii]
MMNHTYTDLLALFGIGGAHPGGIELTKSILLEEGISGKKLLEVGCGTGQSSTFIRSLGIDITPIDNHPLMVQKANKRFAEENMELCALQMNVEQCEFKDCSFDFILSESVLSFTNTSKTLPELFRVLKDDGMLVAVEMTKKSSLPLKLEKNMRKFYGMPSIWTTEEWKKRFISSGFRTVAISTLSLKELEPSEPDIDPSADIDESLFEIMHQHEKLTQESQQHIELSIIRAKR